MPTPEGQFQWHCTKRRATRITCWDRDDDRMRYIPYDAVGARPGTVTQLASPFTCRHAATAPRQHLTHKADADRRLARKFAMNDSAKPVKRIAPHRHSA